jgi:hypothetical protein
VGERFGNHRNAIDAARDAGVSLIVYTNSKPKTRSLSAP